jgi:glycosyltransferase involved in cell wall biosynthesis
MLIPFQAPLALSFEGSSGGGAEDFSPPRARKLRIAFLVPEDRRTGTYFRYHNLAVALRQIGHRVTVYSQSPENRLGHSREIRDGVPYVLSATIPGSRWMLSPTNPGTFAWRLATPVERADVYHLFQPFPSAALTWLWLRKWRQGLFVYDWDDFWINEEFGLKAPRDFRAWWAALWVKRLERKLPSLCHLATTVSHPLAELARNWQCPRTSVVYNGVWPQPPRDKQRARAVLNLRKDAFYVGLMGWSGEVEWCLEALRRYADVFPNLRLAITGRDPSEALGRYTDVVPRVDYLGVLPDDTFAYFNAALDLGMVPMRATEFNRYRLPYKLTDHLAGGTPVLCSRIGEAERLADQLDDVFSCEPTFDGWLDGFGQAVAHLRSSSEKPRQPSEGLLKRFCWLKIAQELSAAYCATLVSQPVAPKAPAQS